MDDQTVNASAHEAHAAPALHVVKDTPADPAVEQLAEAEEAQQIAREVLGEEPVSPKAIDDISDEEALAQGVQLRGDQALEILATMPQAQFLFNGARVRIVRDEEDGSRNIVLGPIMMTFILPFSTEAARDIGRELSGGIEIASGISKADIQRAAAEGKGVIVPG